LITCSVGIAGHITHGGYGYHSRAWGLALDTIVSMRTALASGSIIDVSESSHPDLFFAFRGAAESFGVVTEFTIKTQPAPETVLVFRFDFPELMSDIEAASDAFYYLQELSIKADGGGVVDRKLSFGFDMKEGLFTFYGAYLGNDMTFMTKVSMDE
jgi:FAD/FMN-containing dehydrogenase